MNNNIEIVDNFLEQEEFDKLQTLIMTANKFPWFYLDGIDYKKDIDKFQFYHTFYDNSAPCSSFMEQLHSILNLVDPISILRIKANLLTRTPNIVENTFHVDIASWKFSSEIIKQCTTSIFYMNTNNGYTKFEDGTKVESVANRMVTFPANMKHRGTSCTDEKVRVVINFNYFSSK